MEEPSNITLLHPTLFSLRWRTVIAICTATIRPTIARRSSPLWTRPVRYGSSPGRTCDFAGLLGLAGWTLSSLSAASPASFSVTPSSQASRFCTTSRYVPTVGPFSLFPRPGSTSRCAQGKARSRTRSRVS